MKKARQKTDHSKRVFPLAVLSGQITAKQYFIYEKQDSIKDLYLDICAETGKPGGAARQQAVKTLWEGADHNEWELRAEEVYNDIAS